MQKAAKKNGNANLNMIIIAKGLLFGITIYNIKITQDNIKIGNLINHLFIEEELNSFIYCNL